MPDEPHSEGQTTVEVITTMVAESLAAAEVPFDVFQVADAARAIAPEFERLWEHHVMPEVGITKVDDDVVLLVRPQGMRL